jgi:hypothetical protein
MMVMVAVSLLCALRLLCGLRLLRTLQVLRQRCKGALGTSDVTGLQGTANRRKVGADLASPPSLLSALSLLNVLHILHQCRIRLLGRGQATRGHVCLEIREGLRYLLKLVLVSIAA